MRSPWFALLFLGVLGVGRASAIELEREFRYSPQRFSLAVQGGLTEVRVSGATREFVAGRPDLPWIGEQVEVPAGLRVTGVEIVALESAPLADHAMVPTAVRPTPGIGPIERTEPDPAYFSLSGFQPLVPARLGFQGWQRDKNLACFQICPVRWDAVNGRLERVTRIRVRLRMEPGFSAPVPRLRVFPEWDGRPKGETARRSASLEAAIAVPRGPQPFRAQQVPSLLGSPVAYLIITDDAMAGEFQRLADWKTQSGLPAVVRTISFIRQQYPSGVDDAERIRLFIRDAYSRWGTVWVLLGGDTEILPTRYAYTTFFGGENIACDTYYSCLDGNWNDNGNSVFGEGSFSEADSADRVDLLPEVWVGRAPVRNVAEASRFVNKSLQYVRNPAGGYETRVLFFAEVLFPQHWTPGDFISLDGAELAEDLLPYLRTNPAIKYARLYQNYADTTWEPGALPESRQAVLDSLNVGYNISCHLGHGYRNVMSCANANIDNNDALSLNNGNRLTNLYANNCTSNAIDFPSIGEAFVLAPNGGAVTNIGSSRFDFPAAARFFQEEYFRLLYVDSVNAVGEAQGRQKIPFVADSYLDGLNRWTQFTLLLVGDPELRIYTGEPRVLSVTHPDSIALSDTSFTVHVETGGVPLHDARVVAYKPNDEYRVGYTNAAGNLLLPFRADSVGTFVLTVTGYDCRPYQATMALRVATQPVLVSRTPTVDDDDLSGTIGNANGLLDAGETVDMRVPVRNNGVNTASSVVGSLSTTDPLVEFVNPPTLSYGSISPNATSNPPGGFRLRLPATAPDQREIPFQLVLTDNVGRTATETFQLLARAPELRHFSHGIVDAGGNSNGRPDPGETVTYTVRLRNLGTGSAHLVTGKLRSLDGLASVTDSTATWGTIAPAEEKSGDAMVFVPSSANARLELRISDRYGERFVQQLDLSTPVPPSGVVGLGGARSIALTWTAGSSTDLLGYNVFSSLSPGGPFTKINPAPTDRVAYYLHDGLNPLTRYYYQVSSVDSSGNESDRTAISEAGTTPPSHAIFPIPMGRNTPSSVAVDHIYAGYPLDIVAGADVLYVWHHDGLAPVDADGSGATSGDFTTLGSYYAAGPSISDLDGDGNKEIIGPTWDTKNVYVFNQAGQVLPGWPVTATDAIWSSAAIGDLDNNGSKELVFASNGRKIYAFRANGTEWRDGDSNPATIGVFKALAIDFNYGTPALADLDRNGTLDIVYGAFDGKLYAWKPDGSNVSGFPKTLAGPVTASVAIGYLDGPSDTELDVVVLTGDAGTPMGSLYVYRANGVLRSGFPISLRTGDMGRSPSPALADMNNDGFVDIVVAGTNGGIYVYDRNGAIVGPFNNARYSTSLTGASESSPVVADMNGDGFNDVLMGDENSTLTALSGATGAVLPGFPIRLEAEVKGTPALCDCDGDGMTEIVAPGWDRNLYIWDYDLPFSPSRVPPWPQFHHDAARTGLATNLPFVAVGPDSPRLPTTLELSSPMPNPARARSRFNYSVPSQLAGGPFEISIYDLSGRRVRIIERGIAQPGRHSAEWNLRDQAGAPVDAGVYFLRLTLGAESRAQKFVILN